MRLSSLKFTHGIASYPRRIELADHCNSDGSPVQLDVYVDEAARRAYQVDELNGRYREAALSRGPVTYGEWKMLEPG